VRKDRAGKQQEISMISKKSLTALSAAVALGILGASVASASEDDRDGGVSASQSLRDTQEWERSLGHTVPGTGYVPGHGYVDNGGSAYGYVPPHQTHKHIKR
jgi:hypothetical protein